jgi:hypothetical protein
MSQETTERRSFDQIVKGDVSIKKLSEHRYRITFSKIGKFLLYQVWDKDSKNLNKKRKINYVSAKTWVTAVKKNNEKLEEKGKPLFTPTTIMETEDDCVYAFVIHKAYMNSCGHVVFTVSTKEISLQNNTSKKLVRLPCGKCNNARFDIDSSDDGPCIDYSTFSPINSDILDNIKFTYTKLAWDQYNLTYTDNNSYKDTYTYTTQPLPFSPNSNISIKNIYYVSIDLDDRIFCEYYHKNVPIDLGINVLIQPSNVTSGIEYLDSPSLRFIFFSRDDEYFYVDVDQTTGTVTLST